jgi:hypothetical protein
MIANHLLGDASLVNKRISENQSPNAAAEGDLFCIAQLSLRASKASVAISSNQKYFVYFISSRRLPRRSQCGLLAMTTS